MYNAFALHFMKTIIVIPAFNPTFQLAKLINEINKLIDNPILIIDDGSSVPISIKKKNLHVIYNEKNKGKGYSLIKAFKYAEIKGFSHAVTLDADFQHDPKVLPDFLKIDRSKDVVIGTRCFNKNMPLHRRCSNILTSLILSLICKSKINDSQCGFRRYNIKKVLINNYNELGFQFESEVLIKLLRNSSIKYQELSISTIYSNEISSINNILDTFRFIKLIFKTLIFK